MRRRHFLGLLAASPFIAPQTSRAMTAEEKTLFRDQTKQFFNIMTSYSRGTFRDKDLPFWGTQPAFIDAILDAGEAYIFYLERNFTVFDLASTREAMRALQAYDGFLVNIAEGAGGVQSSPAQKLRAAKLRARLWELMTQLKEQERRLGG